MKKKLLICIFSYNRKFFLKNLIDSIALFYDDIDTVLFDDNSTDPSLLQYYSTLNENIKIIYQKKTKQHRHGGLYRLMNLALDYSLKNKYQFAFFIQDDMQFLWRHESFLTEVENIFKSRKQLLMYSPVFMQKMYKPQIQKRLQSQGQQTVVVGRGVADIGVIKLSRAKNAKLYFDSKGEKYNGILYFDKGFELIIGKRPILAWVPWTQYYREKQKKDSLVSYRPNSPFLKNLSRKEISKIDSNNSYCFLEDYTHIQNKWIPKPYMYSETKFLSILKHYFKYYLSYD